MEAKYIFAIVSVSMFSFMVLVFFALLAHRRTMEAKLQAWLYKMYTDKNRMKDYDTVSTEEDAVIRSRMAAAENMARNEVKEDVQLSLEDAYGKIEVEGIEEITGNYMGDW